MENYDAVIVGAGPGGCAAAVTLARSGKRVLLLERRTSTKKPCGGAISPKAAGQLDALFGPSWRGFIRDTIHRMEYRTRGKTTVQDHVEPVAYMVDRAEFNGWLRNQANPQIGGLDSVPLDIPVICADGVNSATRRLAGIEQRFPVGWTLSATTENVIDLHGRMVIDLRVPGHGYGWIFPCGDQVNIGIGADMPPQELREYWPGFLAKHGLPRVSGVVYPIPCGGAVRQQVAKGRFLLVGDAAGLVNPLTGEGIYYALVSGYLAARAAVSHGDYQRDVDRLVFPELAKGYRATRLLHAAPWIGTVAGRIGPVRRMLEKVAM